MAGTRVDRGERAGQLALLVHDDVGLPLLGPRDQLDRAPRRGLDEQTRHHHLHPFLG